ncbi:hypothetical protein YC2023_063068 [Brassica napus]
MHESFCDLSDVMSVEVLGAPALQDDFYLNLVDWSAHNVLAVGLGNCVYLWNGCSSKVTKLCDLGADDSVCSVGWAFRGTHGSSKEGSFLLLFFLSMFGDEVIDCFVGIVDML